MTEAEQIEVPPAGRKTIDLDAARRARAEAKAEAGETVEGPLVLIDGEELELPAELPVAALTAFGALFSVVAGTGDDDDRANLAALGTLEEAAASLFGETWPTLKAKGLSFPDLEYLLGEALSSYGISLPNS